MKSEQERPDEPGAAPDESPESPPQEEPPQEQDDSAAEERSLLDDVATGMEDMRWRENSLRGLFGALAAEAGRDLIGRISNRVSGGGDLNQIAGDVTVNLLDLAQVEVSYLRRADADVLAECFVSSPSQASLRQLVDRECLVLLTGSEGTGRYTAALAALVAWVRSTDHDEALRDEERVGVIRGWGGRGSFPDFLPGCAYLLDDTHDEWSREIDHLRDLVAKVDGRLVVLVSQRRASSPGRTIEHRPPPAMEVFHRWLAYWGNTTGVDGRLPVEIVKEVADALDGENSPQRAVDHAWEMIEGLRDGRAAQTLVEELPKRLSDHIRDRLNESRPIVGRCFMASVAVLHDLPEFVVSAAALRLADHIHVAWHVKEEKRRPPTWVQLGKWLEYAGATAHRSPNAGGGRVVRLNRGKAPAATIGVLWEDHPTIREPLMRWLDELGEHPERAVRIKAAHAVGKLATLDFETIREHFLDPWARSRKRGDHWLAALALEAAAQDPDMVFTVHRHLRALASGGSGARAIAIQAYGSSIGLDAIGEALRELRGVSAAFAVRRNHDAARSIEFLYVARTATIIVRELASWVNAGSRGGRYTAALAFTRLAVSAGDAPERPALTGLGLDDEVVLLWRNALTLRIGRPDGTRSRLAVPEAWDVLGQWASRYEEHHADRGVIDRVIGAADARCLLFYLLLWRRRKLLSEDLHAHFLRLAKKG